MKEFFIKGSVFLLIVTGMLKLLDVYYTNHVSKHKNLCEKSDWVLNHQNEKYDFAFIGNSRVINGIDINEVERVTGKKGINLGLTGANYAENYLLLTEFFKQGNSVKNLIVQVDMHSLKSSRLPYPFHNTNYMHLLNDPGVYSIFKDNTEAYRLWMWKYIPFVRYMEFSSHFVLYKILKGGFECTASDIFDPGKGSELHPDKPFTPTDKNYAYWNVNENDQNYLNGIVKFSKEKNVNLIFYTAPIYSGYYKYQLNLEKVIDEQKQKAAKEAIPYYDFSEPKNPLCNEVKYFNDNIHMNATGVKQFSSVIADSIKAKLN